MTATATAETLTGAAAIAALAKGVLEQQALVEYETSVLKARREMLLTLVQETGETRIRTEVGTVSVCAGRRTVQVTCPALVAEIKATKERAVRTGRAVANVGDPYVMIRR
jgi:hypothetical protein